MKAVLTQAALDDLLEIARHIGKDNIPAARRLTAALRTRAQAVGHKPRLYPLAEVWRPQACAAASTATI